MPKVELIQIGDSVGFVLPKETRARLKVRSGDTLFVIETTNGVTLTPYDPALGEQLDAARSVMNSRRDALKKMPD
jgi:putative addiction module antidote